MIRNISVLRGYHESKVSEERLVKIKCYLVFNRVKMQMVQFTKCRLPNVSCIGKADLRPPVGF